MFDVVIIRSRLSMSEARPSIGLVLVFNNVVNNIEDLAADTSD